MSETLAERYERGQMFFQAQDYVSAARILDCVTTAAPDNLAARLLLARAYYHSAQLQRAEAELRRVLDQDPTDAYAHLLLGRTLQRQNRPERARGHLRLAAALSSDPDYQAFVQ